MEPRAAHFFLHDGRRSNLLVAIQVNKNAVNARFQASEANAVIDYLNRQSEAQKQDLAQKVRWRVNF